MKQLVKSKKAKVLDKWPLVKINLSIEETLRSIEVLTQLTEKVLQEDLGKQAYWLISRNSFS